MRYNAIHKHLTVYLYIFEHKLRREFVYIFAPEQREKETNRLRVFLAIRLTSKKIHRPFFAVNRFACMYIILNVTSDFCSRSKRQVHLHCRR